MISTRLRLISVVRLGRPHFLAGGFLLHGLGVVVAFYTQHVINVSALIWGQVAITATQWMVHYANEYFDLDVDRANRTPTSWAGGSRVLVAGLVRPQAALLASYLLAAVAILASLILAFMVGTGPLTLPLLWQALLLGWGYSAPPLRLHSRGLGELTIAFVVAGMTPLVGSYLQSGRLLPMALLAVLPLCLLQFAQAIAIEFPDVAGDTAAGKRNLVVRWGGRRAATLAVAATALAYASLPLLARYGLPPLVAVAMILSLPLALWQIWRLARGDWAVATRWDGIAFRGIAVVMGTAALALAAFLLLALRAAS